MISLERLLNSIQLTSDLRVPSFEELKNYLIEQSLRSNLELSINGKSDNNLEIFFVKMGEGKKVIAISGGAHADEPIGIATCFYFIKNLIENIEYKSLKSEFTFLIHPCLDPDGSIINYSWANSYSYPDYLLKNFRNNDPSLDVEHGIPVEENQYIRPELKVFMSNLLPYKDQLYFYVTLHTTHTLSGSLVLFYGNKNIDHLIKEFSKQAAILESPVMDYIPRSDEVGLVYQAPGFLKSPSYEDFLIMLKDSPELLSGYKMPTYEWASKVLNTPICLIAEFPYLQENGISDSTLSDIDYVIFKKEALNLKKENYHKFCSTLSMIETFAIDKSNPWYKKAVIFRSHALKSYEKDDNFFEQFRGLKASMGEIYYQKIESIENEMKSSILTYNLLKDLPQAKEELNEAMKEFKILSTKWEEAKTGKLLSNERQVRLQFLMILSGMLHI